MVTMDTTNAPLPVPLEFVVPLTDRDGNAASQPQLYTDRIFLIGAGGTGARMGMLLSKLLCNGQVIVVDPDRVEERNLLRQHFQARDVGQYKADVVAKRIIAALPPMARETVRVMSLPSSMGMVNMQALGNHYGRTILLGCVDNPQARHEIRSVLPQTRGGIHIDAGNDLRYGQVVVSFYGTWVQLGEGYLRSIGRQPATFMQRLSYDGITRHAPGLLDTPPDSAAENCAMRLDTQSVAANQMAATTMASVLAMVLDGHPILGGFFEFSTLPPSVTMKPFEVGGGVGFERDISVL